MSLLVRDVKPTVNMFHRLNATNEEPIVSSNRLLWSPDITSFLSILTPLIVRAMPSKRKLE